MKENKRRYAFRKGIRRGGRFGQGLSVRECFKIMTSSVRCVAWLLLNAVMSLWELNPVSVVIRRWKKSQPKQSRIAFSVRPRFRDLIGDWFLSYERRKRKLLQWVHSMLPWLSDDVMDFGPSWQDGIVLCALMDTLNPGTCLQVHMLKPHHRVNNCRLGIQLAMAYLDINQATLSPEEMSLAEEGTEAKLVQLVQLVRWRFLKQGSKIKPESHMGWEEPVVPFKCEARGTGIKAGIVGKRTKFNLFVDSVKHLHLSIEIKGPNNEYNKETIVSMNPRGGFKYSNHNVALVNTEDEAKAKVVEDGEGHSFLRQKSFDEGPSHLVIPFDYQCVGEGRFLATYIPRNAGLHFISILSHGNHIPGSPYEVKVSDWVSSWNLVPKGRVMPFDMINNYVEGGAKEGVKSHDKIRCKLSSVASVSKQLTTMRRRILKKVITQGGREIIVKQSGDISMSSSKQDSGCPQRRGDGNGLKLATIEEARQTHHDSEGGGTNGGHSRQHTPNAIDTNRQCSGTAPSIPDKPPFAPPWSLRRNSNSGEMLRGDENCIMADFKNMKMDVSDKWKMAAIKVSISEMANKHDNTALPSNSNLECSTKNGLGHNISIKITHCDSPQYDNHHGCLDDSLDISEKDDKVDWVASTNAYSSKESSCECVDNGTNIVVTSNTENAKKTFDSTDSQALRKQQDATVSEKYLLAGNECRGKPMNEWKAVAECCNTIDRDHVKTEEHNDIIPMNENSSNAPLTLRHGIESKDGETVTPFQRWSFLRGNFQNYLQNSGRKEIKRRVCLVCFKDLPSACTCCVDSGNESNPYCEETDGDESSIFGLDVDNITQSSIDSAMGQFQSFFQGQYQIEENEEPMNFGSKTSFGNVENDRQQRSFISFRKEHTVFGRDKMMASDLDVNDFENNGWKTLRKAHSFSDSNENKKKLGSQKRSISFDSGAIDDNYAEKHNAAATMYDANIVEGNASGYVRSDKRRFDMIEEEAPNVSIVRDSKMVKSIFYIKAKRNSNAFRSYSLPERGSHNDDHDADNDWELVDDHDVDQLDVGTKRGRFALVKKAWKSFDAEILDLLSNSKEYIERNMEKQNQPTEKKFAEISLKLVNDNGVSNSSVKSDMYDGNEEILEVVIDNTIASDGFPSENEDDESLVPTTPTSIRIESGLSSMKASPVNTSFDDIRCTNCLKTTGDSRVVLGTSPLSIEMNKSDNSDWSDDIAIDDTASLSRQHYQMSRNYSPQIMDLPKFPVALSPNRSPTITLSQSYNNCSSSSHKPHNFSWKAFHQSYDANTKSGPDKTAQKLSPAEESDVFTEDSSVSESTSGEDVPMKRKVLEGSSYPSQEEIAKRSVIRLNNTTTNNTDSMKSNGLLNNSATVSTSPKSKISLGIEKGQKDKVVVKPSSRHIDRPKISNSNYPLKKNKFATRRGDRLSDDKTPSSSKEVCGCHCNIEMVPSNDHGSYLSKARHDSRQFNTCELVLQDQNENYSSFVEKEIIPTKYKNITAGKDTTSQQKTLSYQKDFHWDMHSENRPFVEKTLTPTKYRKRNNNGNTSSVRMKTKESDTAIENSIQYTDTAFSAYLDSNEHDYSFKPNDSISTYQRFCQTVLKNNTYDTAHNTSIESENSIWEHFSTDDIEREANFIKFFREMMIREEGSYFTKNQTPTHLSRIDPALSYQTQNQDSESVPNHDLFKQNMSDRRLTGQYKVLPRRMPQY